MRISLRCGRRKYLHPWLRLSTEFCVKRAHPQRVDVAAIRKIAHLEDSPLKIVVNSANSRRDAISRHVVLRRPSVWVLPLLLPYRVGLPTNVVPLLKLWYLH